MNYYDRYKELRELYSISWDPEDTDADIIVQNIGMPIRSTACLRTAQG